VTRLFCTCLSAISLSELRSLSWILSVSLCLSISQKPVCVDYFSPLWSGVLQQVAPVFMAVNSVEGLCDANKPQTELEIRRNSLSLSLSLSIRDLCVCGLILSCGHLYYNKLLQFSWLWVVWKDLRCKQPQKSWKSGVILSLSLCLSLICIIWELEIRLNSISLSFASKQARIATPTGAGKHTSKASREPKGQQAKQERR
jgi:hypothetical protein